jgi:hypothetical protein
MSLTSGRCLNRNRWTELPMLQDVIDHVHVLARHSHTEQDLSFTWRDGTIIADNDDNNEDSYYDPDNDNDSNFDTDSKTDNDDEDLDDDDDNPKDIDLHCRSEW